MNELTLTFPVVYFGIFKKSIIRQEYNKLNYLFFGTIEAKQQLTKINVNTMTDYKLGKYKVGMEVIGELQKMGDDKLEERIQKMGINEPLSTINAFHQFVLSNLTLTDENRLELNRSFLDAVVNNRPEIYIAKAYRIAVAEEDVKEIDGEEKKLLEGLEAEISLADFVEVVKEEISDLPTGNLTIPNPFRIEEIVKKVVAELLPADLILSPTEPETEDGAKLDQLYLELIKDGAKDMIKNGYLSLSDFRKLKNFNEIATLAEQFYEKINHPDSNTSSTSTGTSSQGDGSPDEIEDGWVFRFYESASFVADKDMEVLWAKILAGEVSSPGSYSLRALETLKNMSKKEALLFKRVSRFVMTDETGTEFIFVNGNLISHSLDESFGVTNSELRILQDCGLLAGKEKVESNPPKLVSYQGFRDKDGRMVLVFGEDENGELYTYERYPLLPVASELLDLVREDTDTEYIEKLAYLIRQDLMIRGKDCYEVKKAKAHRDENGNYTYDPDSNVIIERVNYSW